MNDGQALAPKSASRARAPSCLPRSLPAAAAAPGCWLPTTQKSEAAQKPTTTPPPSSQHFFDDFLFPMLTHSGRQHCPQMRPAQFASRSIRGISTSGTEIAFSPYHQTGGQATARGSGGRAARTSTRAAGLCCVVERAPSHRPRPVGRAATMEEDDQVGGIGRARPGAIGLDSVDVCVRAVIGEDLLGVSE